MIPRARRLTVLPHLIFGTLACIGALLDRASFNAAIYDSLFHFVSLEMWGAGFGMSALAAAWVLLTGSFRGYVLANLTMLVCATSWVIALCNARFVDDIDVTALTFGLWLFVIGTCLINAAIPVTVLTVEGRNAADR